MINLQKTPNPNQQTFTIRFMCLFFPHKKTSWSASLKIILITQKNPT